ncbi:MAG TPA: HAD family hydrolase [Gemmatimonadaceae bacterium]|nr:HAD family hydrolase [Gemmatimonadaceae bacterium]
MTSRPLLRGCLLDVDGTLIDSNDAHARSWVEVLQENDFDVTYAQIRALIGMGGDKLVRAVTGLDVEQGRGKELAARRMERFRRDYLPSLCPTPGAQALVRRMMADDLRLVIATSAREQELNELLEQAGLSELIRRRTTSDDAEDSKPDPDIVHAALHRGDLAAETTIMLGDTPYDVEAAQRANVRTIALRCGGWWADDALGGAVAIYDDPAELVHEYARSPLGER